MAQEAVFRVKEAEDQGKELIRKATEEARHISSSYARNAMEQKEAIMVKANHAREETIRKAVQKAEADCEALMKSGSSEKNAILNPGADKLKKAVRFITERIVSA